MVLQSFLQYRAFTNSQHVRAYADKHPSPSRIDPNIRPTISQPPPLPPHQPSFSPSVQTNWSEAVTAPTSPINEASPGSTAASSSPTHSREELRELPDNMTGEKVELGLREKAAATPQVDHKDPFLVTWDEHEAENPMNWSWTRKWFFVGLVTSIGMLVGAAASIDSAASTQASGYFGVSSEVMQLQTAVFLIGFGIAAPFLSALSEIGGRNPIYVITLLLFSLFEVGSALSKNIQTRVILRFFAGVFGSTPLSNAGGSIADIANARQRTFVFPVFANAGFLGPVLAYPLIFQPFGFNTGELGLAFIPVAVGLCITSFFIPLFYARYIRVTEKVQAKKREDGDKNWEQAEPPPEERLVIAMFGTFLVPIALFYQAWTSFTYLPPWPCLSVGFIFGASILTIFISSYMYIIDVYKAGSATALGSLTFFRYIVSGGVVMFTPPMYKSLGNQWALTLLALLSLVFCSVPWIFYFYGRRIRQKSRYVPAQD